MGLRTRLHAVSAKDAAPLALDPMAEGVPPLATHDPGKAAGLYDLRAFSPEEVARLHSLKTPDARLSRLGSLPVDALAGTCPFTAADTPQDARHLPEIEAPHLASFLDDAVANGRGLLTVMA